MTLHIEIDPKAATLGIRDGCMFHKASIFFKGLMEKNANKKYKFLSI